MSRLRSLQGKGIDPYPVGKAAIHTVSRAIARPDGVRVAVVGRILRIRDYGGSCSRKLRDWSGDVQ